VHLGKDNSVDPVVGSVAPTTDNPNGQQITVTFNSAMFSGNGTASTFAHEGSHVADASDWVSSGFNPNMNPTRYASEYRAFQVAGYVAEGFDSKPVGFDFGGNHMFVYSPWWTPAETSAGIKAVLRDPNGPYHNPDPNSKIGVFQRNTHGGH
jgi:hypothetical protein